MRAKRVYSVDGNTLIVGFISGFIFIGFLDPINWPKQIALISLVPFLLHRSFITVKKDKSLRAIDITVKLILASVCLAVVAATLSTVFARTGVTRTLWGLWGRNNGIFTIVSLWCLAIVFYWLAKQKDFLKSFLHEIGRAHV